MMLAHIDEFACLCHSTESCVYNGLRLSYEGYNRTVGGFARIHVEELYSRCLFNLTGYLLDNVHVATLAEIGHALNNLLFLCHCYVFL